MATSVRGNVARIYADTEGCYIRLKDTPAADTPKDGYFQLKLNHPNYNALYSLALTAAANGRRLEIRIVGDDIRPTHHEEISYMTVDW
ncbi:MAG: hypothetical protein M5U01_28925 [Ardenticatenaceae bacterium]|nr:hypothetical protein [Ardenticatenaceae bacterium]